MTPKRNAPNNGSDPESQHRMHVQETSKAIAEASSARWVPASIVEATTDAILCPVPMNRCNRKACKSHAQLALPTAADLPCIHRPHQAQQPTTLPCGV